MLHCAALAAVGLSAVNIVAVLWGGEKFQQREVMQTSWLLIAFFGTLFLELGASVSRKVTMTAGLVKRQYGINAAIQFGMAFAAPFLVAIGGFGGAAATIIVAPLLIYLSNAMLLRNVLGSSMGLFALVYAVRNAIPLLLLLVLTRLLEIELMPELSRGYVSGVSDKAVHLLVGATKSLCGVAIVLMLYQRGAQAFGILRRFSIRGLC